MAERVPLSELHIGDLVFGEQPYRYLFKRTRWLFLSMLIALTLGIVEYWKLYPIFWLKYQLAPIAVTSVFAVLGGFFRGSTELVIASLRQEELYGKQQECLASWQVLYARIAGVVFCICFAGMFYMHALGATPYVMSMTFILSAKLLFDIVTRPLHAMAWTRARVYRTWRSFAFLEFALFILAIALYPLLGPTAFVYGLAIVIVMQMVVQAVALRAHFVRFRVPFRLIRWRARFLPARSREPIDWRAWFYFAAIGAITRVESFFVLFLIGTRQNSSGIIFIHLMTPLFVLAGTWVHVLSFDMRQLLRIGCDAIVEQVASYCARYALIVAIVMAALAGVLTFLILPPSLWPMVHVPILFLAIKSLLAFESLMYAGRGRPEFLLLATLLLALFYFFSVQLGFDYDELRVQIISLVFALAAYAVLRFGRNRAAPWFVSSTYVRNSLAALCLRLGVSSADTLWVLWFDSQATRVRVARTLREELGLEAADFCVGRSALFLSKDHDIAELLSCFAGQVLRGDKIPMFKVRTVRDLSLFVANKVADYVVADQPIAGMKLDSLKIQLGFNVTDRIGNLLLDAIKCELEPGRRRQGLSRFPWRVFLEPVSGTISIAPLVFQSADR